jgi:hypothetical protein
VAFDHLERLRGDLLELRVGEALRRVAKILRVGGERQ